MSDRGGESDRVFAGLDLSGAREVLNYVLQVLAVITEPVGIGCLKCIPI